MHQIDSQLFHRQGGAVTNFERTLPDPQSELAQQVIKSPYSFEFLSLGKDALERDIEKALIEHIRDFLLELGLGFSFVGSQYPFEVDGRDFRIDLLFYHFRLHCFVVLDLKVVEFEPEFSGKMNFYVTAIDNLLRGPKDNPTIGIILCRTKRKTIAEYALSDVQKPIGVATYHLQKSLPESLQESLPSIEQLEIELQTVLAEADGVESKQEKTQSFSDDFKCDIANQKSGLILRQLTRKIGKIPARTRSQIEALPLSLLEDLGEALLDFEKLSNLKAWLQMNQPQ
jgi:predicted nuclease of restriction endonuclease-like (RecB) superfamily